MSPDPDNFRNKRQTHLNRSKAVYWSLSWNLPAKSLLFIMFKLYRCCKRLFSDVKSKFIEKSTSLLWLVVHAHLSCDTVPVLKRMCALWSKATASSYLWYWDRTPLVTEKHKNCYLSSSIFLSGGCYHRGHSGQLDSNELQVWDQPQMPKHELWAV